jgi:type I restriction enzyme M protein
MSVVAKTTKKKDLGIYYTPQVVVDFIFSVLSILKEKEDLEKKRWQNRKPGPHYPSVIDPAVGEGIFLKAALDSGFTKPQYVFGIDIDEDVKQRWVEINLLKSFGSKAELEHHFFHQNGLSPLDDKKVLRYKKGGLKEFNVAVGNPPYGGVGLGQTELTDELISHLAKFEVLPESVRNQLLQADAQNSLFDSHKSFHIKPDARKRIKSFPIEVLFIDRFIQLVKPGGWIAIIIPDGILANSNLHYVRQFIAQKTKVLVIVSLPRDTFKQVGTSAKTSILFLQKFRPEDNKDLNYPVFLSSINRLEKEYVDKLTDSFKEFQYHGRI